MIHRQATIPLVQTNRKQGFTPWRDARKLIRMNMNLKTNTTNTTIMKTSQQRLMLLLLAAALVTLFSASCRNTVRGAGRDVENVGNHIERATH
jgi:predicted small secreted protein